MLNFQQNQNFFITGAGGFIGSRLLKFLGDNAGFERLTVLSRSPLPTCKTVISDLQSGEIPSYALENIDTIYHLAGYSHDLQDAELVAHLYQAVNVDATVQLAHLAVSSRVKRFVLPVVLRRGVERQRVIVPPKRTNLSPLVFTGAPSVWQS